MPETRICIIYTGGTIAMDRKDGQWGQVLTPPRDPQQFFLRMRHDLESIVSPPPIFAEVVSCDGTILNKDSTNMTPDDWSAVADAIYVRMDDFDSFVVIHGTDTMHFTASAVAFAFGPGLNKPIVFTGAQTDLSVLHGDARINLLRAVRVASEPLAEVVICFGDYVFRACRTQKSDERRFDAFESPAHFPIGDITEQVLLHPNAKRSTGVSNGITFRNNFRSEVFQVSLIPGLRPKYLEVVLNPEVLDGIILQSFGAGNVPNLGEYSFMPFIRKARGLGIPTIITSQFPANSTLDTVYEPGLEAVDAGAIPTGNMTNAAATAKFRWVLAGVRGLIDSESIDPSDKIARVDDLMTQAYIGEMDPGAMPGRRN